MLAELLIRDLVLIPRLQVRFGPGLNVISGETGAGKSLIVGSLRLLCGEKANADLVRPGADRAVVEAVFDLDGQNYLIDSLRDLGLELEDGELILRREIPAQGRGRVRANGLAVPLDTLRKAAELLIDLHGQHDHQSLLRPSYQRTALDDFGDLLDARDEFAGRYEEWKSARASWITKTHEGRENREKLELERFQRQELEAADPRPGEREELVVETNRLEQAEFLRDTASRCVSRLLEGDGAVQQLASELADAAAQAEHADPAWKDLAQSLRSLAIAAAEAATDARALGEQAIDDPARLQEVRDRLRIWDDLLRKYGPQEEDVIAFRERLADTAASPEEYEAELERLRVRVQEISDKLVGLGTKLRKSREKAAQRLCAAVETALTGVGMDGSRFEIEVRPKTEGESLADGPPAVRAGRSGLDDVEFRLAANRGQELRPLKTVASGGEISRVMLALKSVVGATRGTATMAFDEIDAGVGGTVGPMVGDTLAAIGRTRQVLCITHLAPIASRADQHFRVVKYEEGEGTVTTLEPVAGEDRVQEIARMLGTDGTSAAAVDHARELLGERA